MCKNIISKQLYLIDWVQARANDEDASIRLLIETRTPVIAFPVHSGATI